MFNGRVRRLVVSGGSLAAVVATKPFSRGAWL
jgi:hypothetical protein